MSRRAFALWTAAVFALGYLAGARRTHRAPPSLPRDNHQYYYEDIFDPFFEQDEPGIFRSVRPGALKSSFEAEKPKDAFRVFILGGSTAAGFEGPGALEDALPRALPGRKVEVLNCGMSGYDAAREALIEREILRYKPDAVVFLSGQNDFHMPHPMPSSQWAARLLGRLQDKAWFKALSARLQPDQPVFPDSAQAFAAKLAAFAAQERANAASARSAGVPAVLVIPPVNVRDMPPDREPPFGDPAFARGWSRYARGDWAQALSAWKEVRLDPASQGTVSFLSGRAAERLKRWEEAARLYDEAQAGPAGWTLCAGPCREAIRGAAKEEGAILADADALFRRESAPRAPGLDFFVDEFHWSSGYHRLMSKAVIDALRADPRLKGLPWDDEAVRELARAPESAKDWAARELPVRKAMYYAMEKARARQNSAELCWLSVFWLDSLHDKKPEWFSDSEKLYAWTVMMMDRDFSEASRRSAFQMSAPPLTRGTFFWHLGAWRLMSGDLQGAARDLARARQAEPGWAGIARTEELLKSSGK